MLKVNNINVRIGNIRILSDIHLHVSKFTSIIGRNGAGKTLSLIYNENFRDKSGHSI